MRKLIPAFAAVLVCTACAVPAFDPSASAAVAAFRASHVVGSSYPTIGADMDSNNEPDFNLADDTFIFMPERWAGTVDPTRGFVIRRPVYDNSNQIWYQWWDGSKVKWLDSPASYTAEEGLPSQWPVAVKGGPYLGAIIFDDGDLETHVERLFADTLIPDCDWNPVYGSWDPGTNIDGDLAGIVGEPVIVGMSMNSLTGPDDRIHVLVRNGASFSEVEADVSSVTPDPSFSESISPYPYPLPFLGTPRHLNYARDPDQARSFAQWMEGDAWHTCAWKGSIGQPPIDLDEPPAIDHRIDAALTTEAGWSWPLGSYLLSTEKQIGRVYHYNGIGTGSLVAEFGLGTLHFIGEMYLNGEWQLLFSRAAINYQSNPITVRFETRGIYTKDLLNKFGL